MSTGVAPPASGFGRPGYKGIGTGIVVANCDVGFGERSELVSNIDWRGYGVAENLSTTCDRVVRKRSGPLHRHVSRTHRFPARLKT